MQEKEMSSLAIASASIILKHVTNANCAIMSPDKEFPYKTLQVSAGGGPVARARALIFNPEGKILLVRHHHPYWSLPGGKVDALESTLEAVHRELIEEMDLPIDDLRLRFITEWPERNSIEFFFVGSTDRINTEGMDREVLSGKLEEVAFHAFGSQEFKPEELSTMPLEEIMEEKVTYLGVRK